MLLLHFLSSFEYSPWNCRREHAWMTAGRKLAAALDGRNPASLRYRHNACVGHRNCARDPPVPPENSICMTYRMLRRRPTPLYSSYHRREGYAALLYLNFALVRAPLASHAVGGFAVGEPRSEVWRPGKTDQLLIPGLQSLSASRIPDPQACLHGRDQG